MLNIVEHLKTFRDPFTARANKSVLAGDFQLNTFGMVLVM